MALVPNLPQTSNILHLKGFEFFLALLRADVDALLDQGAVTASKLSGVLERDVRIAAEDFFWSAIADAIAKDPGRLPLAGGSFFCEEDQPAADPFVYGPGT